MNNWEKTKKAKKQKKITITIDVVLYDGSPGLVYHACAEYRVCNSSTDFFFLFLFLFIRGE